MSRPGDCLTAGPSIESARRGIRLRSQMARSGQDMFLAASKVVLCRRGVCCLLCSLASLGWPGHPIPQTNNTKQTSSAQPVESAGKDRPAGAESTRGPGTITKTAIIPMTSESPRSQKDFASRLFTHAEGALITLATPHHEPRATAESLRSRCNSASCKGPTPDGLGITERRTHSTCHP